MKIRDVMTKNIEIIGADTTMSVAATKMAESDVGMLPVYEKDENGGTRLVGVVTDRDLAVRGVAKGLDASKTPVGEVMTRKLAACSQNDEVSAAAQQMKELQVRRLLVLDDERRPVGVLSLGDLATEEACTPQAGETLASVCQTK